MVWVKLDDHFDENPKIASVGPLGIALWVTGLAYCNRNLTDGFIPWATARKLLSWEYIESSEDDGRRKIQQISVTCGMSGADVESDRVINLLLDAALWDISGDGSGYTVHDYDQFQPLKEKVEAERQASAERTAKSRSQSRGSNTVTNIGSNSVSNTAPVPVPVPISSGVKTPSESGAKRASPSRKEPIRRITSEELEILRTEFDDFPDVDEVIGLATSHDSAKKYPTNQLGYTRNWLRREREYRAGRSNSNGRNNANSAGGASRPGPFAAYV